MLLAKISKLWQKLTRFCGWFYLCLSAIWQAQRGQYLRTSRFWPGLRGWKNRYLCRQVGHLASLGHWFSLYWAFLCGWYWFPKKNSDWNNRHLLFLVASGYSMWLGQLSFLGCNDLCSRFLIWRCSLSPLSRPQCISNRFQNQRPGYSFRIYFGCARPHILIFLFIYWIISLKELILLKNYEKIALIIWMR